MNVVSLGRAAAAPSPAAAAASALRPAVAPDAAPAPASAPAPAPVSEGTRLSLSAARSSPVVYARPQRTQVWAAASDDSISRQIESNLNAGQSLERRWSGLGGALLTQFARTGEDYGQSRAANVDSTQGLDAQLQSLREGAAEVTLQLKTRSGQSVELRISARSAGLGADQATGLQVQIKSQGVLGMGERQALGRLAAGLDKALGALVQESGPELDLQGLLDYDRSQFASLSLDMKVPQGEGGALRSFSLRLGAQENRLALTSDQGELNVRLDAGSPLSAGTPAQRQQAIARQLRAVDAAGARGQADERVLALFKSAFAQMHGSALEGAGRSSTSGASQSPGRAAPVQLLPALAARTQGLVSGLADFEASFSSQAQRFNGDGVLTATSQTDYRLSQKTTLDVRKAGEMRVQQVLDMQLKATILQARNGGMLIPSEGNYDVIQIDDREKQSTVIEAVAGELVRAARETDSQQRTHWKMLVKHRVTEQSTTPEHKSTRELLI